MGKRLAFVLAAFSVLVAALAATLRPDAFFVGDPGVKLIAARSAVRSPATPLEIPLPVVGGERLPHVDPFFAVHGSHAHAITSEFFPLLTAPLLAVFGLRGLYVWPALGFIGALAACGWLARILDSRRDAAAVAVVTGLGTPLLVYALEFWEHTLALAVGTAGAALLLDAARPTPDSRNSLATAFGAGLLAGLAVLLRPEAAWFAVAVAIASRSLVERPSWRALALAVVGAGVAVAPLVLHTWLHFGTLVPPHAATNAALVDQEWLAGRLQIARSWLTPSPWTLRGPVNASSFWSVAPAAVMALASLVRAPERDGRRFLWRTSGLYTLLVVLTAPNDGGGQWGPRYLLFAYVPMAILASDFAATVAAAVSARRGPAARRPAAVALAMVIVLATLWVQRAAYRQLRGAKATYGRMVDFVAASTTRDGQVVTDVWWLDQLAASALDGQNVLYAGSTEAGRGIVRRLSDVPVPTVTVFRSREQSATVEAWTEGTCYVEEGRQELPVRALVAIRLTYRCGGAH